MIGGLVTYQHSFAGDSDRPEASFLVVQPFVILQFGRGYYATAYCSVDLSTAVSI